MNKSNFFNRIAFVLLVVLSLSTTRAEAQEVPQAINFQAIARGGDGEVMANTPIQIQLTILDGSATGTEVYKELRALTTNDYGSFSFQIGVEPYGVLTGSFDAIDWATGNKFLKIDYDPTNTLNFELTLGTIEFATVPFAFAAGSVSYIDLTGVQDGDVLIYNASTKKFEAKQMQNSSVEWDNVQNKPDLFSGDYDDLTGTPNTTDWDKDASDDFSGKYEDLENKPTLFDKDYNSLTNKPSIKDSVMANKFSGKYEDLENLPVLFDKNYNSLTNKPSIKDSVMANKFSGDYTDLANKPALWDSTYSSIKNTPDLTVYATKDMNDGKITNLANPTDDKDAVNKKYVNLSVSITGDTLYLGKDQFVIIKGISGDNHNTCQVNGANGKVYTFMTHNLGADYTADPLTPDRKLNGAYYQWGRKDAVAYAPTATDDDPGIVGTWNTSVAPDDSWKDDEKTANDPCPEGFRVPSKDVWQEVIDSNTWTAVGTWNESNSNYSSGYEIKPDGINTTMLLPASGRRSSSSGSLYGRGYYGCYWISTQGSSTLACTLHFSSSSETVSSSGRNYGFSVRCLAD